MKDSQFKRKRDRQNAEFRAKYAKAPAKKIKNKKSTAQTLNYLSKGHDDFVKKYRQLSYNDFLVSKYWSIVKSFVKKRDKNMCYKCLSKSKLHVHHITYKNHFFEHLHLNDLITLCYRCHKEEHNIFL